MTLPSRKNPDVENWSDEDLERRLESGRQSIDRLLKFLIDERAYYRKIRKEINRRRKIRASK